MSFYDILNYELGKHHFSWYRKKLTKNIKTQNPRLCISNKLNPIVSKTKSKTVFERY